MRGLLRKFIFTTALVLVINLSSTSFGGLAQGLESGDINPSDEKKGFG